MKKNIIKMMIGAMVIFAVITNISTQENSQESLLLENIEALALASGESGGETLYCCPLSTCYPQFGDLCVVCSTVNPGKCAYWYDQNEGCGLAGQCEQ
jgi:hypothetical protein